MSHFYASIQGDRGEAKRCGSKKSGITGHIRGWNIGVKVVIQQEGGEDVCYVYATGGSLGYKMDKLLARFKTLYEAQEVE